VAIPAALKGVRGYMKGISQIWQCTPGVAQCWAVPQPHHAKSSPKPGKKPGHHSNSQRTKLLSSGTGRSPSHAH